MAAVVCHKCGTETAVAAGSKVQRGDTCASCSADLHCCYNCRFYDPGKHNECAEPQAEYVKYKDEANFCDYFDPGPNVRGAPARAGAATADDTRRKFDSLFKK